MKKTPEKTQKPLNVRQERFCEFVVSGMSSTDAYIKAGYEVSHKSAGTAGPRMLENVVVKARITALRTRTAERFELKRDTLARHLLAAVMTPIGEIDQHSPLSTEFTEEIIGGGNRGKLKRGKASSGNEVVEETIVRRRVKSMDKTASARLLCEMMGWKEPDQLVVESGPKTLESLEARAASVVSALDRNAK